MKKRVILFVSMAAMFVVGGVAQAPNVTFPIRPLQDRSVIGREAYDQIRLGMSKEKVEDLLGGPPRFEWDLFGESEELIGYAMSLNNGIGAHLLNHWVGPKGVICVAYYDDRVYYKSFSILPGPMKLNGHAILIAREQRPFR